MSGKASACVCVCVCAAQELGLALCVVRIPRRVAAPAPAPSERMRSAPAPLSGYLQGQGLPWPQVLSESESLFHGRPPEAGQSSTKRKMGGKSESF